MTTLSCTTTRLAPLTNQEVADLSSAIQAGDLASSQVVGTQGGARRALKKRIAAGEDARCTFIEANKGLVGEIAKKYVRAHPGSLAFDDVFQDGMIGLCHAVGMFDPSRGYKFSTYAYWWIRKTINDGARVAEQHPVRASERGSAAFRELCFAEEVLATRLDREPTDDELAVELGSSVDQVQTLRHSSIVSFDVEGFKELSDSDGKGEQAFLDSDMIKRVMVKLPEKERAAIEFRFGFDDPAVNGRSFMEVGALLGVSEWTARERVESALEHLRGEVVDGD